MKVLHVNCNYFGHNAVHRNMIEIMNKNDDLDNYVFSPVTQDCNIKLNKKIIASKCINKLDRLFFFNKSRKIRKSLIKKLDISSFNIIHAYTVFTDGNVAYELFKKYNIPYVVAVRNTDVNAFFKYMFHLRRRGVKILQNASKIFFLSKAYQNLVIEKYIPQSMRDEIIKKCVIIPNGINNYWLENINNDEMCISKNKQELNQKIIKIVYAGEINKNKNLITTCKTVDFLKQKDWNVEYIVVGKIKDKGIYNAIKNSINYKGVLSKEKLLLLYRRAHIFVMPSHKETFGLVYAEAMSQGLPVVYSKGQGFDMQFNEGIVGYSVQCDDYKDISDKIIKIIKNYDNISNNCKRHCTTFDWKVICDKYYHIYKEIIK